MGGKGKGKGSSHRTDWEREEESAKFLPPDLSGAGLNRHQFRLWLVFSVDPAVYLDINFDFVFICGPV